MCLLHACTCPRRTEKAGESVKALHRVLELLQHRAPTLDPELCVTLSAICSLLQPVAVDNEGMYNRLTDEEVKLTSKQPAVKQAEEIRNILAVPKLNIAREDVTFEADVSSLHTLQTLQTGCILASSNCVLSCSWNLIHFTECNPHPGNHAAKPRTRSDTRDCAFDGAR